MYKRILLKLSGESLGNKDGQGIDENNLLNYVSQIKKAVENGIQVGVVLGGGNIFRGVSGEKAGTDRVTGDYMGMLATVINSMALKDALLHNGIDVVLYTSFNIQFIGVPFVKENAILDLNAGKVVIVAGGTGNPYFTTDSAAALRAIQLEADILLKGTRVDGVYSDDPEKNPNAVMFDELSFDEVIAKGLRVMDLTAFALCKENNMPILVYNSTKAENFEKIISGQKIGTIIK
jgi:uridylate kinase